MRFYRGNAVSKSRRGNFRISFAPRGIQKIRDHYAEKEEAFVQTTHDKATGAASGIIGMLEVVESRGACAFFGFVESHRVRCAMARELIRRTDCDVAWRT